MAVYSNQNYTNFRAVNLKDGVARFEMGVAGQESTLSIKSTTYTDGAYAWNLPAKSGSIPISGTFVVQLQAITSTSQGQSTIATVAGIRAEDALTVTMQGGTSASYGTPTTAKILYSATPGNGSITLNFINLGATTGYTEHIVGYTAMR